MAAEEVPEPPKLPDATVDGPLKGSGPSIALKHVVATLGGLGEASTVGAVFGSQPAQITDFIAGTLGFGFGLASAIAYHNPYWFTRLFQPYCQIRNASMYRKWKEPTYLQYGIMGPLGCVGGIAFNNYMFPKGWKTLAHKDGRTYYYNPATGETKWDRATLSPGVDAAFR